MKCREEEEISGEGHQNSGAYGQCHQKWKNKGMYCLSTEYIFHEKRAYRSAAMKRTCLDGIYAVMSTQAPGQH